MGLQALLLDELPQPFVWLFTMHLECIAGRNDCTISVDFCSPEKECALIKRISVTCEH
jgi:hypothetical protein